jgi:hypothetical protein
MGFYRAVIEIGGICVRSTAIHQSDRWASDADPIRGLLCTIVTYSGRDESPLDAMIDAGMRFWKEHEFSRIAPDTSSFKCEVDSFRQIGVWEYVWLKYFSQTPKGCTFYRAAAPIEH